MLTLSHIVGRQESPATAVLWHVTNERHPLGPEVEQPGRQQPADDQDQGTGTLGATALSPKTTASAMTPTMTVVCWVSPGAEPGPQFQIGLEPVTSVPVSFGARR